MAGFIRKSLPGAFLAVLTVLAACAQHGLVPAGSGGLAVSRAAGTIVAMRRVVLPPDGPFVGGGIGAFTGSLDGADLRLNVLGAFGMAGRGPEAVEFIVREDGAAQPVSVIQADDAGLRPGERIVLIRGPKPRIARAGA